ncbi:MAG TPA: hypothetical protein VGF56_12145 [Rhizomicrobium sp.]|jgi:hypothetical protein
MAKKPATRQERLAQALRENLKRRKAADRARTVKAPDAAPDGPKSTQKQS